MQTAEFLRRILPPSGDGWYCWCTPAPPNDKGRRFDQRFTRHISQMVEGITQCSDHKINTYYAMSSFKERGSRAQENVAYVKSFWIDIDCGEAKAASGQGYATKRAGAEALLLSVKAAGLPRPMLVDSGNGLHAYWPLAEAVTADVWRPVACQIVAALQQQGLIADWGCSADHSRILRAAGSVNWKDKANGKPVEVKLDCPDYSFQAVAGPVQHIVVDVPASRYGELGVNSDLGMPQEPPSSDAGVVADRCAQVAIFRDTRGCLPEPQWRAGIAVVKACIDGESTVHAWSKGYSGYSAQETELKIASTKGPTTCAAFARLNPAGCDGCKFKGTITSPIQLGKPEPEEVTEEEVIVAPATVEVPAKTERIPLPPLPDVLQRMYRWTKQGMSALSKAPVAEGSDETAWVWTPFTDAYIVCGETTFLKEGAHMKLSVQRRRGMPFVDIDMPTALIMDKQGLLKFLASHNIGPYTGKENEMVNYLKRWFDHARQAAHESRQHTHYGWQTDGGFLIGNRLFKPNEAMREVTVGDDAVVMLPAMRESGTLEDWTRLMDEVYGAKGMEQYQFIIAAGFGAPLMRMTGQDGVTMNLMSTASGVGKTTVALAALSIWGKPTAMAQTSGQATINAIYSRIGVMNSLPCYVDEITKATPQQLSSLAYDVTGGHSKDRVSRSGAAKEVKSTWSTILITSGNASTWSKIGGTGEQTEAQLLRVLEYRLVPKFGMTQDDAREKFARLATNYGTAGPVFIQYVLDNIESVQQMVTKIQNHIAKKAKMKESERFWLSGAAASITGALIAKQLGLLHFDVNSLMDWCVERIVESRNEVAGTIRSDADTFSKMIADLNGGVIVTDKLGDHNTPAFTERRPNGPVYGRLVQQESTLWISASAVMDWCKNNNADLKELIRVAIESGQIVGKGRFDLGVGAGVPTTPTMCYRIAIRDSE